MSGVWKRSMVEMVGHPQTKGRATGENKPRPKPPRHTSTLPVCYGKPAWARMGVSRARHSRPVPATEATTIVGHTPDVVPSKSEHQTGSAVTQALDHAGPLSLGDRNFGVFGARRADRAFRG